MQEVALMWVECLYSKFRKLKFVIKSLILKILDEKNIDYYKYTIIFQL